MSGQDEREEVLKSPIKNTAVPDTLEETLQGSGMKPSEAVARAEAWWDRTGRKIAQRQMMRGTNYDPVRDDIVMKSGIVLGLEWVHLDKRERFSVVKAWHASFLAGELGTLKDDRIPEKRKIVSRPGSKPRAN